MKVAVVEDNSAVASMQPASDILILDVDILVQGQLQLWIAHEVRLHLDAAIYGAVDYKPVCTHEHCYALEDVHKNLVFLLAARGIVLCRADRPVNSVAGHSPRVPLRQIETRFGLLDDDSLIVDARLEMLSVRGLRVAKVNHLVKELIDQHKVFPDALFVQHSAKVLEHLCHLAQQFHNCRRRDILASGRDKIQPVLLDEDVADTV
mmetsp:Transcript_13205/g.31032  ORF Transcript_13205/g.31032 Transcript_13205/m.31032 type:complete len:206 (-) Transcript_13205:193-810(-)